jgi:hypothetical protein
MRIPTWSLTALFALGSSACAPAEDDCFEVPSATAPLLRGGWDRNGVSLRGGWDHNGTSLRSGLRSGGGWDLNSDDAGERLLGVHLRDAESGAPVRFSEGRLIDAGGAALEDATLLATTELGEDLRLQVHLHGIEGDVPLHEVLVEGQPVCDGLGLFVEGSYGPAGEHLDVEGVTLACTDGVIAKCAFWGYAPWIVGEPLHQACTRMARADYCGDGMPWTRNGTFIDVTDPQGIQALAGGPEMSFEAGWDEHGAVCVSAPRYDVLSESGTSVLPPCWQSLPRCEDTAVALEHGARIMNFALHEVIPACR